MSVNVGDQLPLASGGTYSVSHVFSDTRVLVSYDGGLSVLVDFSAADGSWDLSGQPASPDEQAVIQGLMPDVDTTGVDIVKDS